MAVTGSKKGFFGKLSEKISDVIMLRASVDDELLDELEEALITSDIGMETTMHITEKLREDIRFDKLRRPEQVRGRIEEIVRDMVDKKFRNFMPIQYPLVIMLIGVNGGGKTTSIAKLAHYYKNMGKSVLVAAADTFRAAAADQLAIWAERIEVPIVRQAEGADPSAVIFDGIEAAKARKTDVLIIDTAGRLHNKKNLMNELEKMNSVITNRYPEAYKETLLVLDATTGKNAVSQAEEFSKITNISGLIITKLDGTAKGGIAITVADEYDLPIKFIGVGERKEDLIPFNPEEFAKSIFE